MPDRTPNASSVPAPPRPGVVTRFHGPLLLVTFAVTITGFLNIPAQTSLPMHWAWHGQADWLWPRDAALLGGVAVGVSLVLVFALIGRLMPLRHLEAGGHVLRAMLSVLLALLAMVQIGLVMIGIGSDLDVIRMVCAAMSVVFLILGNELRHARPQPYAGLRLPWTPCGEKSWTLAHQVAGATTMLGALTLALAAWLWPDPGTLIVVLSAVVVAPIAAGLAISCGFAATPCSRP